MKEQKVHFKMYKKGRLWLTCALSVVAMTFLMGSNVQAAEAKTDSSDTVKVESVESSQSNSETSEVEENSAVNTDSSASTSTSSTEPTSDTPQNEVETTSDSSETSTSTTDSQSSASAGESGSSLNVISSADTASSDSENNNQDDLTTDEYVAMGDSISQGWDGKETVTTPFPKQVSENLSFKKVNTSYAIGGAKMDGTVSKDFPQQVDALLADKNLNAYDIVTIDYGANDYLSGTESLVDIQKTMIAQITRIINANANIKIYGILPINAYKYGGPDDLGPEGYSENDLMDAEAEVYESFGIPYLDWRNDPIVTDENYTQTLANDSTDYVHPTQETYNLMAKRISEFITNHMPSTVKIHASNLTPTTKFKGLVKNSDTNKWYFYDDQGNKITGTKNLMRKEYTVYSPSKDTQTLVTEDTSGYSMMYFNLEDGTAVFGTLVADDSGLYYLNGDGNAATGMTKVGDAYYYFDTTTHKALTNQFVQQWGNTYYAGDNGQLVQGLVAIDGKAYNFGTDGTYYERGTASGYLQDVADGNWYWFENGNKYTGFKAYTGSYYYFVNGVRQENQWVSQWGKNYYVGSNGRAVQGIVVIDGKAYDFGSNNTFYKRGTASGYLQDTASGSWYWFENGNKYTGFRFYMGSYYYFVNGVRQENQWVSQWGKSYYVGSNGRTVQGIMTIDGVSYDFGNNNTFYSRGKANGYLKSASDGDWYWFENGNKYTGFRFYMGSYYYFVNGVRQFNQFVTQWGHTYFLGPNGRAIQGVCTVDGKWYNFGNDGTFYSR